MNKKRFIFTLASFLLFPVIFSYGEILTLTGKKLNFFLEDMSGTFYVESPNPKSKSFRELLFRDLPPTSYLTLIIDGKPYRPNDGRLNVVKPFEIVNNTIRGIFKVDKMSVRLIFVLTNLTGRESDAVVCQVSYKNEGSTQVMTGARFLFDTVFGESSRRIQLYFPSKEKIEYDRMINQANIPEFVFSGPLDSDSPGFGDGLYIYSSINDLKPDTLIVGNWKKLDENDLNYVLDPLAKFKYNQFSNPDAATAVLYKNVFVKSGEVVNFGCVLSVARIPPNTLRLNEAVVLDKVETPTNTNMVVTITNVTNTAQPQVYQPFYTNFQSYDTGMLRSELFLLEKASMLIDRIDAMILNSNRPTQVEKKTAEQESSDLKSGLEKSVAKNGGGDPFDERPNWEGRKTKPEPDYTTRSQDREMIPYSTRTNQYVNITTNINLNSIQTDDPAALQRELYRMQAQYEKKLAGVQDYYLGLLEQQEKEFKEISTDYKQKVEEKEQKKSKNKRLDQINQTIISLDKKIEMIEKLLELNLDFESMPPERLSEIETAIQKLSDSIR